MKAAGIEAVSQERFIMVASTLSKAAWQALNRDAGMRLRLEDLIRELVMNFWRICGVIETKDGRVDGEDSSMNEVVEAVWSRASVGNETERHV